MSWSANTPDPVGKDVEISAVLQGNHQQHPEGCNDAFLAQQAAAIDAAKVLAAAVGRPDDLVRVTLSGHANPDHAPYPGYADEFITISVYASPRPADN